MTIHFFLTVYETELLEDLEGDTSGYFRRVLCSLVTAYRQVEDGDDDFAEQQAQKLIDVRIINTFAAKHLKKPIPQYQACFKDS